jgi:hypothetical protein
LFFALTIASQLCANRVGIADDLMEPGGVANTLAQPHLDGNVEHALHHIVAILGKKYVVFADKGEIQQET